MGYERNEVFVSILRHEERKTILRSFSKDVRMRVSEPSSSRYVRLSSKFDGEHRSSFERKETKAREKKESRKVPRRIVS